MYIYMSTLNVRVWTTSLTFARSCLLAQHRNPRLDLTNLSPRICCSQHFFILCFALVQYLFF